MNTIWKYELSVTDEQYIKVPVGAEILSMQTQYDKPCIWAKVNPNEKNTDTIKIIFIGTGHDADRVDGMEFIGTFQIRDGLLVFHVFIKRVL